MVESEGVFVGVVVLLKTSLLTCFGNGAYFGEGLGLASVKARADTKPMITARRTILQIY